MSIPALKGLIQRYIEKEFTFHNLRLVCYLRSRHTRGNCDSFSQFVMLKESHALVLPN